MTDAEKKAHAREVLTEAIAYLREIYHPASTRQEAIDRLEAHMTHKYFVVMATDWVRGHPTSDGLLVELRNRDGTRPASHLAMETTIALHGLPIKEQPE